MDVLPYLGRLGGISGDLACPGSYPCTATPLRDAHFRRKWKAVKESQLAEYQYSKVPTMVTLTHLIPLCVIDPDLFDITKQPIPSRAETITDSK